MGGAPTLDRDGGRRELAAWLGLLLVAACFATDFVFDVRHRDLFSWMDPYQYYEFALGVLEGRERFDRFEIPSIFPFFLLPLLALRASIPVALSINVAALLLLLVSLQRLCRELGLRTPSPVVAILVLCSPLLLGLSRTLYIEFTLTALATAAFVAWLRFLRAPGFRAGAIFGLWLGLGFMTKTTFPLFMVAPVGGAVLAAAAAGRNRVAAAFVLASLIPLILAGLLHASVFTPSLGYYVNLVSTGLPFMRLMGPPEIFTLSSAGYYFGEVGRSFLLLLSPGIALALWMALRGGIGGRSRAMLWLWLLGPLVLLTFHPLKEPRHVAPCVVPAVLLLVLGVEALPGRGLRVAAMTSALALASFQYGAVTLGWMDAPYFMDRSLHYAELRQAMRASGDLAPYRATPPALRKLHWSYDQNVALVGFPPNESLALTWQGFPGVVFDLDTFEDPKRFSGRVAFAHFEDLFFLAGINTYNRRCGWRWYHPTLSREAVLEHADFLVLNDFESEDLPGRFPGHELVATIERKPGSGNIRLLRSRRATTPYRALYARRFLAEAGGASEEETRVVARELLMVSALAGDLAGARALLREFPVLRTAGEARNIYWIGGYPSLLRLADRRLSALSAAPEP